VIAWARPGAAAALAAATTISAEEMIELRGIDKTYKLGGDAFNALAAGDLDLRRGEFTALTGRVPDRASRR